MIYTTTYSKTITVNNQTWSADDSAIDIITNGIVVALPNIKVISSATSTLSVSQTSKF